jgi:hypothetical protein
MLKILEKWFAKSPWICGGIESNLTCANIILLTYIGIIDPKEIGIEADKLITKQISVSKIYRTKYERNLS